MYVYVCVRLRGRKTERKGSACNRVEGKYAYEGVFERREGERERKGERERERERKRDFMCVCVYVCMRLREVG